jgi:hypothetical protein
MIFVHKFPALYTSLRDDVVKSILDVHIMLLWISLGMLLLDVAPAGGDVSSEIAASWRDEECRHLA